MQNSEAYVDLLRLLSSHDFGDWSNASIDAFVDAQGWRIGGGRYDRKIEAANPFTSGNVSGSLRRDDYAMCLRFVVVEKAGPADFDSVVDVTTGFFGLGPQVMGGFGRHAGGTFKQWREPERSGRGATFSVQLDGDNVSLALYPSDSYEYEWSKIVDFGDGPSEGPLCPLWVVQANGPSDKLRGQLTPGIRIVTTWADLTDSLRASIVCLATDLRVLGDGMSIILAPNELGERNVRFLIDAESGALVAEATRGWGGPSDAALQALGWQDLLECEPHSWYTIFLNPTDEADAIADLIVKTLQAFGARLPEDGMDDGPGVLLCRTNYVSDGPFDGCRFAIFGLHVIDI